MNRLTVDKVKWSENQRFKSSKLKVSCMDYLVLLF